MSQLVPGRATSSDDFSAGMVRAVARNLIPSNGAWRLQNMLVGDDGPAYRRGGTSLKSNAAFGSSGLRMLWDGVLAGGQRTVFANASDFGTLAVDDATPVNLGGPGLALPVKPAVIDGLLFAGGSVYGGSRKTAGYATGTVAVTTGSTQVVGTGTAWGANVDDGMVLTVDGRVHAVASVQDNTHLTLERPFAGSTTSGLAYSADPVAAVPAAYTPDGSWVVAGNRLVSLQGNRITESVQFDSTTWPVTNSWLLPDGVEILGGEAIRDTVYVFTTGGVWALGNLDYDLTDAAGNTQQSLRRLNSDVILWGEAGIATWQNQLVVPALDGLWLVGGSSLELLSRSITPLWQDYVARGCRPGQATVHSGHLLLPILDFGGSPVDLLVCRLDRPTKVSGLGTVWPWTNWTGAGAQVAALAVRVLASGGAPLLVGADRTAASRVISYPPLRPDGPRVDHDGTAPIWELVTRDFPAGELGTVVKVRLRYELNAAQDTATVAAAYGTEARPPAGLTWGSFVWGQTKWQAADAQAWTALAGAAPESDGSTPKKWRVAKRVRYVRFRFRGEQACERAIVRAVEVFVRPSGRL